jgi:tetrahydromethanopterin S-methyltransferase subunit F
MDTKLEYSRAVNHPARFDEGPRCTRIDTVVVNGVRYEVPFFTENGKLVHVGPPRKI